MLSNTLCPPPVGFFNFRKQIYNVVGLPKIILYVIILGRDAQFYKFVFKSTALLEKAVDLTFDFH